jgi:hypothetical protein
MKKQYTFNEITFGSTGRKWTFAWPGNELYVACRGVEMAHKVARILSGSLKRSGKLDNLGRANITSLLNRKNNVD